MNLEKTEIKSTKDLILAYEALTEENAKLKQRCSELSHRNLFLENENANLQFSQKMFWINQENKEQIDSFLEADVRV